MVPVWFTDVGWRNGVAQTMVTQGTKLGLEVTILTNPFYQNRTSIQIHSPI